MRLLRLIALFLISSMGVLHAQYVVKKIVFYNPGAYPEADLDALVGLKPGDKMSKAELQAAAQRLVNTGYFDDVEATVDGPLSGVEARFKLAPIDAAKLIPATYRNLVWLSPEQIAAFQKSVPLLALGLPEAGTQQAEVEAALKKFLAASGVEATVSHELVEPSTGHVRQVVEYRVDQPYVQVGKVTLSGVSAEFAAAMNAAVAKAKGSDYNEGDAGFSTAEQVLMPLLDAGYLDARLENVQRSVMAGATAQRASVEMSGSVNAGEPYRISAVSFAGTDIESKEAFAKTARIRVGGLASRRDVMASLKPAIAAYHSHGYMDAVVDAVPTKDAATHQVAYAISVVPGGQYRLRKITINGLPPSMKADFDYAFNLHPGDLYDEDYVGTFLIHNGDMAALAAFGGAFRAAADPNTHLIDLEINFSTGRSITVRPSP
jgi:outer membrane protein insertion porin family